MDPQTVMASEFKKHCLALLDRVAETGTPIVVTKRGRPIARLVPFTAEPRRSTEGSVTLLADDDEAFYSTGERWDAATRAS